MSDNLFVYGLLKSSFHSHIPELRVSALLYLGRGVASGRLYDVGRYPGAKFDSEESAEIFGEIYEVNDQMDVLAKLDDFEGVHEHNPEYRRVLVTITMPETGQALNCWAYEYCYETEGLQRIESGKYEDDGSLDLTKI
ncbi:MAG: gamma-glutamylcyclotransferase family protein [Bacteroidota bacterium]